MASDWRPVELDREICFAAYDALLRCRIQRGDNLASGFLFRTWMFLPSPHYFQAEGKMREA
jgi:hypothetical protein